MFLPQRLPGQDWLGVVVAIPEPWVSHLTDLRLRLGDPAGSRIPAHITLMPPTPVARDARADVIDHPPALPARPALCLLYPPPTPRDRPHPRLPSSS
mgnify:CR=1 FL=1